MTYQTTISIGKNEPEIRIDFRDVNDLVRVWIDDEDLGLQPGGSPTFSIPNKYFQQNDTTRELIIISATVGLQNYGEGFDKVQRGVTSNIYVNDVDYTSPKSGWKHQIGLKGEFEKVPC